MEAGNRPFLLFTIPLFVLVAIVSLVGLFHAEVYDGATPNWLAQTIGQDTIDLLIVAPLLLVSGFFAYRGNVTASYLWMGSLFYLVYTFLIYCFAVRFNPLFIPYCAVLGLSFYSLLWVFNGFELNVREAKSASFRIAGFYFIAIALVFMLLWLSEIVPASLNGQTPSSIVQAGLLTNPVHVIDLALFLPATFIVGRLSLSGRSIARILVPAFLTFFILMNLTIAVLALIMMFRGLGGNYTIPSVMTGLALFSLGLLIKCSNENEN